MDNVTILECVLAGMVGIMSGMCGLFFTKQPVKYLAVNIPICTIIVYVCEALAK